MTIMIGEINLLSYRDENHVCARTDPNKSNGKKYKSDFLL